MEEETGSMEIRKTFQAVGITIIFILASFQATYAIGEDFTYDANGNMIQGPGGLYYEYNNANQLKRVRVGGPTGEVIAEYWYDYTGKRKMKNESGVITYYVFDDFEQIVYPNGTVVNITYYIANGERLAKKVSTAAGDKMYYFHPDHLGSTSIVSDESGQLVEKTEYYPYGSVKQGGGEQYLFTGKELDKGTGLYYYGARYYNPELTRFSQADPVVQDPYDPQNLNRYAYVRDNPLKYTDPTGNYFLTTGIDIASLAISVQDIKQDPANKWNWVALTADVATLALPVVAGGGMAVRVVKGGEKASESTKLGYEVVEAGGKKYQKITGKELQRTRNKFNNVVKPKYWEGMSRKSPDDLRKMGIEPTKQNIDQMKKGKAPYGPDSRKMQLHHKTPLEYGGTNDPSNLRPMTYKKHQIEGKKELHTPPFD